MPKKSTASLTYLTYQSVPKDQYNSSITKHHWALSVLARKHDWFENLLCVVQTKFLLKIRFNFQQLHNSLTWSRVQIESRENFKKN